MKLRTESILIFLFFAAQNLFAQEIPPPKRDYKNDIGFFGLNFGNTTTNSTPNLNFSNDGGAGGLYYRRWINPKFAIKIGIGTQTSTYNEIKNKESTSYYTLEEIDQYSGNYNFLMLGFEIKKQAFKNVWLYFGANLQAGLNSNSHNYITKLETITDSSKHYFNNSVQINNKDFTLLKLTPIAGVKYQFFRRMEVGIELKTLSVSSFHAKSNFNMEMDARFNANLYLGIKFGQ